MIISYRWLQILKFTRLVSCIRRERKAVNEVSDLIGRRYLFTAEPSRLAFLHRRMVVLSIRSEAWVDCNGKLRRFSLNSWRSLMHLSLGLGLGVRFRFRFLCHQAVKFVIFWRKVFNIIFWRVVFIIIFWRALYIVHFLMSLISLRPSWLSQIAFCGDIKRCWPFLM